MVIFLVIFMTITSALLFYRGQGRRVRGKAEEKTLILSLSFLQGEILRNKKFYENLEKQ